jgi:formate dehydrogenase major subunit
MSEIKLTINGREYSGEKGETILTIARREGIEIPTLCHDPRLEPYSSCYVCVVEVDGMRGLQSSCSTRIVDGMKVQTETERLNKARKTALDLLLSNHYADCVAPCKQTCPAGVDVQGYIALIEKGLYTEAVALIKDVNPLPAICGRVCVRPCEVACRRNLLDEGTGVGVDYLKRFVADYDMQSENPYLPEIKSYSGKKVAVIGSGPGGLSSAYFLRKEGHAVDIYEASPAAGGMLRYGIPEYRLPNDILQKEVESILKLGINLFYNQKLGGNLKYKELKENYDAVILTIGSQKGTKVGCEGDDATNVLAGIDYLRNMEMTGQRPDFSGKTVAVVGGGNTAMDCCRSALRCGASKVYVIYRRTEKEMPANPIEIHESKVEGVQYLFLTNPIKINQDEKGRMKTMTCIRMELGEPDSSGRRSPKPMPGSEFELELDYVLAAIGQKTVVDFMDDINDHSSDGKLQLNRWGNLDADPTTLQTGIKSIFAAGDGVTGPATIIEAIAQAKIVARSCHQFLQQQGLTPPRKEFISRRDNFKVQNPSDYHGCYGSQFRQEMPVLDPSDRYNFNEVELGYKDEAIARQETKRCLECGCSAYYTCDLKRYATEYNAEQQKFDGEFKEYKTDFAHPFIELDNNKCILCSRCIRICREIAGASALGLVNRGFDTYVAPSLGDSLIETDCESCGLCISTCPTGAISENFPFKPGPVLKETVKTICNYCSVGCEINLHHKNGFFMEVTGAAGIVNPEGNICRYSKFGYHYLNNKSLRITKPLKKLGGKFVETTFEDAYNIISEKIGSPAARNTFFAGARLTNEELYLIRKLAEYANSSNIGSFNYLGRGISSHNNAAFAKIPDTNKILLIGSEINEDHPVVGYMVQQAVYHHDATLHIVTEKEQSSMLHKSDEAIRVPSCYNFIKAINFYLTKIAVDNGVDGYMNYCAVASQEEIDNLLASAGISRNKAEDMAKSIVMDNFMIIASEKYLSANAIIELRNLILLSGKKPEECLILLRDKNNSQGLMALGFGKDLMHVFGNAGAHNLFIFGEDPLGCAIDKPQVANLLNGNFLVVQDHFMTETARVADLVLPASFPVESGGSYINTQGQEQYFEGDNRLLKNPASFEQLLSLLNKFGSNGLHSLADVRTAMSAYTGQTNRIGSTTLVVTSEEGGSRRFENGCDSITNEFESYFRRQFK